MKTPNLFDLIKTKLFKSYSDDAGKMLLHTATFAWTTSAIAQIFGIATNDKISKEQKKFMIPQEIADAAINILAFYTITNVVQNFTKWLASSGKFITPKIQKFCQAHNIQYIKDEEGNTPNIGKAILDKVKDFEATIRVDKQNNVSIGKEQIDKFEKEIETLNNFYDEKYAPFESGFKIVGNVIGAIFSSNIITPLLRNPIAAAKQKQAITQEKLEHDLQEAHRPIYLAQNSLSIEDYKKRAVTNSGSMRI